MTVRRQSVSTTSRKTLCQMISNPHGPSAAELPGAEFGPLPSSRDSSCAQLQVAAQSCPKPEFVTTL